MLQDRKLEIVNPINEYPFITENKMIIDFVEQYIKESNLKVEVFDQINHVR